MGIIIPFKILKSYVTLKKKKNYFILSKLSGFASQYLNLMYLNNKQLKYEDYRYRSNIP